MGRTASASIGRNKDNDMRVRNGQTGEIIEFPDGTPDDEIHARFSGAQQQNVTPLAQSFAQGAQQVVPQLAQRLIQGPEQSTLPNIGGGAMVGLTPQQAQFTLQSAQQSNVDSMANKLQQQQMVQQSLEAEKDRAQVLKLRQQDLKNRIAETKLLTEQAKYEAELKSDTAIIEAEEKTAQEQIKADSKWLTLGPNTMAFNPATGAAEYGPDRQFAPQRPAEIKWEKDTIMMTDPDTQQEVPVLAWVAPGQEPQPIGPVPPSGRSGTSAAATEKPALPESVWFTGGQERINAAYNEANEAARSKAIAEGKEYVDMDKNMFKLENEPRLRAEAGLKPFATPAAEGLFMRKITEKKQAELKEVLAATGQYQVRPGGKLVPVPPSATPTPEWKAAQAERAAAILAPLEAAKAVEEAHGRPAEIRFEEDGTPYLHAINKE
jgi:hypothetical protein